MFKVIPEQKDKSVLSPVIFESWDIDECKDFIAHLYKEQEIINKSGEDFDTTRYFIIDNPED